uniref:Uncharacterized protein n=1 Tax=Setaria viridis TaxID=4556 RepID=A0A4U6W7Y0_SETVI|nr:hypothetical protein SEVIR_1G108700v2 [Setaria viridis]
MPLSDGAISIANYDIPGLVGMLSPFRHLSVKEQMEIVRKNPESFRKFPSKKRARRKRMKSMTMRSTRLVRMKMRMMRWMKLRRKTRGKMRRH